jgi:hypothetical protein
MENERHEERNINLKFEITNCKIRANNKLLIINEKFISIFSWIIFFFNYMRKMFPNIFLNLVEIL